MQLFYNSQLETSHKSFTFDKTESRHIVRVLRKKEGDILHITNGRGQLFYSKITIASEKKCVASIIIVEEKQKSWQYYLHIAIAPTKNNDRFEWFLEKATEIGIDEITPLICNHSERKIIKQERFQKIIESAAKQSLKYHFPKLNETVKFDSFINSNISNQKFIAHCEDHIDKKLLQKSLTEDKNIIILIGPEGDFSPTEISLAKKNNYIPITLGESRLRTETAGIVATNIVSLLSTL